MNMVTREVPPGSGRRRVVTEPASGPRRWREDGIVRWDETHPRAAPQFRCAACGKWIALNGPVILLTDRPGNIVLHTRCHLARDAHARWYPDCPECWHDTGDHHASFGTRAGIAAHLGLWP